MNFCLNFEVFDLQIGAENFQKLIYSSKIKFLRLELSIKKIL